MSFIRFGQSGQYIDTLDESEEYIYPSGNGIVRTGHDTIDVTSWKSYLVDTAAEIWGDEVWEEFIYACEDYYDEPNFDPFPGVDIERAVSAEIVCQHIDSRFDDMELTDEMVDKANEWV